MKKAETKKFSLFYLLFLCILLFPLAGEVVDNVFPLKGSVSKQDLPAVTVEAVWEGQYQADLEQHLKSDIDGRNIFIKIYNQLLYSLFRVSANKNVVIGENGMLYEPEYLDYNFNIREYVTDEGVEELIYKLEELDQLLEENGKELYIFLTPSKPRYCSKDAPYYYKWCGEINSNEVAYDKFIKKVSQTDLDIFDSISYINQNQNKYDFTLWYASGTHWSNALGSKVAEGFNEFLRERSKYNLSQISSSIEIADKYETPDADLYETLNLFTKPEDDVFYKPIITVEEGPDKPNVFLRGGSFMGQSLKYLVANGVFGSDIHFENNYYFTDRYSTSTTISNFNTYEELDVKGYLAESDILILEVNANKIWTMSWGFIDYIFDNPDLVKGE